MERGNGGLHLEIEVNREHKIVLEIAVETGENKKKQMSKLSENKENSQTHPKDVFGVIKRWIN